jgi:hypothetical protein
MRLSSYVSGFGRQGRWRMWALAAVAGAAAVLMMVAA